MKKLFIIILFFLFLTEISSVNSQVSIEWVERYNVGFSGNAGFAITSDDSGYVYVTGTSHGALTRQDLVVLKYSSQGTNIWTRRISEPVNNTYRSGFDILVDDSNNVIVGGIGVYKYDKDGNLIWASSDDVRFEAIVMDNSGNIFATGGASWHFLTRKFRTDGSILWTQTYQYLNGGTAQDITIDRNEDVIMTGFIPQTQSLYDIMTIKYSNSGNQIWTRRYNGGGDDFAFAITSDRYNNVYVTGSRSNPQTDILTIKYSPDGDTLWEAVYGLGGFDRGFDIEVDSLGFVYVGGVTFTSSFVTLKYSPDGNLIWSRVQTSQMIPDRPKLKLDKDRNVYMSFVSYRPGPYSNYAVVKYNNDGVQQWIGEYNYGGVSLNYAYDLAVDANANVYLTGNSGSIATVKFIQNPTSINPITNIFPIEFKLEQNYPNPFNPTTKINFSIPKQGNVTLKIYDVLGKQVLTLINEIKQIGKYEVEFNARQHGQDINLASGIYFYRIESREFTDIKRMILIK